MANISLRPLISKIETARGRWAGLLTILAGALSVLAHAPFFIWPAFVICMAGLYVRLSAISQYDPPRAKRAFWAGYLFGFGYFLASLYWIASAFLTRGSGYIFLAPFGMLLLPAGLALFWGLAGWAYSSLKHRFKPSGFLSAFIFTAVFFIAEFLRGHILSGFPWNLPGYIWPAGGAVSQSASLFGIYGLSFLTLWLAASFALLFARGTKPILSRLTPFIFSIALFSCFYAYGSHRLSNSHTEPVDGPYIRVVQTQIDQLTKYDARAYSDLITRYLELSQQPSDAPLTHIVWPEGAVPGLPLEDTGLMDAIDALFFRGPDLLMGVTRRERSSALEPYRFYNSMAALSANGSGTPDILDFYNKSKLVPFGEYFPGNELISGLDIPGLSAATASFDFGTPEITQLPDLPPVSIQICYEAIFSGFTPMQSANTPRPEWILTVSNDAWFGKSTGPSQHFNQVRYRAIEEGLPIVRAASNGVSGFVDPYGRALQILSADSEGVIDGRLPKPIEKPLFSHLKLKN